MDGNYIFVTILICIAQIAFSFVAIGKFWIFFLLFLYAVCDKFSIFTEVLFCNTRCNFLMLGLLKGTEK